MLGQTLGKPAGTSSSQSPATLQVDVIADMVCPWSYLGKHRLDDALAAVHGPSEVKWHPFQINPKMPAAGLSLDEYLTTNFGGSEAVRPGLEGLTEAGKREGIHFRFDRMTRVPNTLNAHRLVQMAQNQGLDASRLVESIFRAIFEHGLDIGDTDELVRLGGSLGLDANSIHEMLQDDLSRRVVLAEESEVRSKGVVGVPNFLVNRRLLIVGAQSADTIVSAFDRAIFGADSDLEVSTTVH
jgi:predicted DsbA family dithiol-disulfide isomerase